MKRTFTARMGLVLLLGVAIPFAGFAKDAKKDPDAIGDRDVAKGVNFYSLEKEIALGKGLAQEIERQARIIDDPVIAEYVNRIGQNLVRNSDATVPFTILAACLNTAETGSVPDLLESVPSKDPTTSACAAPAASSTAPPKAIHAIDLIPTLLMCAARSCGALVASPKIPS